MTCHWRLSDANQYQYSTDHPITVALGPHRYAYGWQGNGVKPIRMTLRPEQRSTTPELNHLDQMTPVRFRFLLYEKMKLSSTSLVLMWLMVDAVFFFPISCHGDHEKEFIQIFCLVLCGGVKVLNGGRGYAVPPTAEVESSYGQDVELTVVLGNGASTSDEDDGSIQTYSIQQTNVSAPALPCIRSDGLVQSGGSSYVDPSSWSSVDKMGNTWTFVRKAGSLLTYEYNLIKSWDKAGLNGQASDGWQPDTYEAVKIQFTFSSVTESAGQYSRHYPLNLQSVAVTSKGTGWKTADNKPVVVVLGSYPFGHSRFLTLLS